MESAGQKHEKACRRILNLEYSILNMPPLHQLILSVLDSCSTPISRYEIMLRVNKIVSIVEPPYSPGSIYHAAKLLQAAEMTEINHDYVSLMPEGRKKLAMTLLAPLPDLSATTLLYRALCVGRNPDAEIRAKVKKLLQIEMININQMHEAYANIQDADLLSLNSCRKEIGNAVQRIVLNIGA
jgi:hypothetical protein